MKWSDIRKKLMSTHWFSRKRYVEETQIIPHYIGPLSSTTEWHAAQTGFYYGISPKYEMIPEEVFDEGSDLYHPDAAKEKHYAQQAYTFGTFYSDLTNKASPIILPGGLIGIAALLLQGCF